MAEERKLTRSSLNNIAPNNSDRARRAEVGRWELMVLKDGEACYTTYITDDVLGWLSEEEVTSILDEIKGLEA